MFPDPVCKSGAVLLRPLNFRYLGSKGYLSNAVPPKTSILPFPPKLAEKKPRNAHFYPDQKVCFSVLFLVFPSVFSVSPKRKNTGLVSGHRRRISIGHWLGGREVGKTCCSLCHQLVKGGNIFQLNVICKHEKLAEIVLVSKWPTTEVF